MLSQSGDIFCFFKKATAPYQKKNLEILIPKRPKLYLFLETHFEKNYCSTLISFIAAISITTKELI
jgi:hypothetical protein